MSDTVEKELVLITVDVRKLVQDFPLCSTFKEIDEINQKVRKSMDAMRSNISTLETLAQEEVNEDSRAQLLERVEEHKGQLVACQRQFRLANVKQMGVLEGQSSRDLLSTSNGESVRRRRGKEELVTAHGSVTRDLQAISRQLADTVDRSRQTVDTLGVSSQVVGETHVEYRAMGGVIGQSRKLITKYGRREFTDKVLIVFALAFFFAVVLYILRKRVFPSYGPLELVLYLFSLTSHLFGSLANVWPF